MTTQDASFERSTLSVRVRRDDGRVTIEADGELDLACVGLLHQQLARAMDTETAQIVLDISNLDFIDSAGLGELLVAALRSAADSNRLWIRRPEEGQVAELLAITGIDKTLNILD